MKLIDIGWDKRMAMNMLTMLHLYREREDEQVDRALERVDQIDQSLDRILDEVARVKSIRAQTRAETQLGVQKWIG